MNGDRPRGAARRAPKLPAVLVILAAMAASPGPASARARRPSADEDPGVSGMLVGASARGAALAGVAAPAPAGLEAQDRWLLLLLGLGAGVLLAGVSAYQFGALRALRRARADRDLLERAVAERTRTLERTVAALQAEATERARAEGALRNSEERFRLAFKTSPDPIAINRASDGLYVAVNDGFTRVTGYTDGDVLGRSSVDLGMWVDPADRARMVEAVGREGAATIEARFRRRDGTTLLGAMSAKLLVLDGAPHVLTVTRDVTAEREAEEARRRLEEELRQAQKLEAVGRLAGGVAHDFNNLLTGITANVSLALMEARPGDPTRPLLEEIEDAAKRAAGLTRQLLAFSRRQPLSPRRLSLNDLVTEMRRLLGRLLAEDVRLDFSLAPELPAVTADAGQMEQVLLNLVLNARDALPKGGRIEVATYARAAREGGLERPPDAYAVLAVRDTGLGMDADTRRRIFEPFFTTKADGRGTGLGLSTVYGIVQQHKGFIEVESEPGCGSRFAVHLPAACEAQPERAQPRPREASLPRGSETLLLVEDEHVVREATRSLLTRLGYNVLVAASGLEALSRATSHPGPIDLVVTDVVMPGMNGGELAARLRAARPEVKVLFISGYDDRILGRYGLEQGELNLLAKPFTVETLAERVRAALSSGKLTA